MILPTGYHMAAQPDGSVKLNIPSSIVAGVRKGPYCMMIPQSNENLPQTIQRSNADTEAASTELESTAVHPTELPRTVQQSVNSALNTRSNSTKSSGDFQSSGSVPMQTSDSRTSTRNVQPIQYRLLKVEDAHKFLNRLKSAFMHQPEVFNKFLDVMKYFQEHKMDLAQVIEHVHCLFRGHLDVIEEFYGFLPPEYQMSMHQMSLKEMTSPTASTESNSLPTHLTGPFQPKDSIAHIALPPPPSPIQQYMDSTELADPVR